MAKLVLVIVSVSRILEQFAFKTDIVSFKYILYYLGYDEVQKNLKVLLCQEKSLKF